MEDAVIMAIQDWVKSHDSPWVFPGKGDNHISKGYMGTRIRELERRAGIKNIERAVHMLRHTAGADLRKKLPERFVPLDQGQAAGPGPASYRKWVRRYNGWDVRTQDCAVTTATD